MNISEKIRAIYEQMGFNVRVLPYSFFSTAYRSFFGEEMWIYIRREHVRGKDWCWRVSLSWEKGNPDNIISLRDVPTVDFFDDGKVYETWYLSRTGVWEDSLALLSVDRKKKKQRYITHLKEAIEAVYSRIPRKDEGV